MTPITFVTPRYGREVVGGAEAGARKLASRLAADGRSVSVITSCAQSMQTWADHYREGSSEEEGVHVTRCSVDHPRAADFDAQSDRLLAAPGTVERGDALAWIDAQGPTSSSLLEAVRGIDDGVTIFYPYLYHPTVRGLGVVRTPTILYPAAHRELPLELEIFDDVFGGVDGLAFHSAAEQAVVHDRFAFTVAAPQALVGLPVEPPDAVGTDDPAAIRAELGLGEEPFVLCLGRVDRQKGTHDLVQRFARFRSQRGRGHLVLAGPVGESIPSSPGVTVLGPVSEEHKVGLLAAADVLINPSFHESFSIVILEAWLAGTPVLVNGWCAPLTEHCELSGGGLHYRGVADFELGLGRVLDEPELRHRLGRAGRTYVEQSWSWPAVRRRLDGLIGRVC